MIITLKGADFSNNNIGPLSSWLISREIGDGARYSGPIYVSKGGTLSATIALAEGYEVVLEKSKIFMSEIELNNVFTLSEDGKSLIININEVTGNIFIKISTSIIEDTSDYTLTIRPYPSDAVVTLVAAGYTQSGNSITVPNGTVVSWTVSAEGYIEQTGIWTANGESKAENIILRTTSGEDNSVLDLSKLSLAHCGSSKLTSGTSNENLTYTQETHELKINSTGWYKVSYFTTPIQVGTEIEYTTNYSNKVTGNFVGIYTQEDLVDGVAEVNGSFWPTSSGFGMYAPGSYTETSPDHVVIWDKNNKKIKTSDMKMADFLNGKTVKLKMLETGVEVYVDGEKITWGTGSVLTALTPGTNYYLGFHNSGSGKPLAQTINYIGPIR